MLFHSHFGGVLLANSNKIELTQEHIRAQHISKEKRLCEAQHFLKLQLNEEQNMDRASPSLQNVWMSPLFPLFSIFNFTLPPPPPSVFQKFVLSYLYIYIFWGIKCLSSTVRRAVTLECFAFTHCTHSYVNAL